MLLPAALALMELLGSLSVVTRYIGPAGDSAACRCAMATQPAIAKMTCEIGRMRFPSCGSGGSGGTWGSLQFRFRPELLISRLPIAPQRNAETKRSPRCAIGKTLQRKNFK